MAQTALATTQKPLGISTKRDRPSNSSLVKSLTLLATARQVSVSKDTLILYASELSEFAECDLSAGLRDLAVTPRKEFETAFPDLGTVLQAVKSYRRKRKMNEESEMRQKERKRFDEAIAAGMHRGDAYAAYEESMRMWEENWR